MDPQKLAGVMNTSTARYHVNSTSPHSLIKHIFVVDVGVLIHTTLYLVSTLTFLPVKDMLVDSDQP